MFAAGFMKMGKELPCMNQTLVKVENLKKHFPIKGGFWERPLERSRQLMVCLFPFIKGNLGACR